MSFWCEWDGAAGFNTQSDGKGYLVKGGLKISGGETNYRSLGFYPLTIVEPTMAADETEDAVSWSLADGEITKTWTVRDKTQDELDAEAAEAGLISREMYYVLKWLISEDVISSANISNAPAALVAAYQARARLEA